MNVIRVHIDRKKLMSLPDDERILFLSLGLFVNEINALTRMLYWAANRKSDKLNEAEENGMQTIIFLLMRLLAGKLYESHKVVKKKFSKRKLAKKYVPKLRGEPADALKNIARYFDKPDNHIKEIRDSFGFHYSPDSLDAMLPYVTEPLYIYLNRDKPAENLFFLSEQLIISGLPNLMGKSNIDKAADALVGELFKVSIWFTELADGLIAELIKTRDTELRESSPVEVKFATLLKFDKVQIPWFTDPS